MKSIVVSCHAKANKKTFKHGSDITIYQFDFKVLHDELASKVFTKLQSYNGNIKDAKQYWQDLSTVKNLPASTYFYKSGSEIEDYDIWALDSKWMTMSGIFNFDNFGHKLFLGDKLNPSTLSDQISTDTESIFWLACTG